MGVVTKYVLGVVLIGDSQVQSQKKTVYLEGIGRGQIGEWGGGGRKQRVTGN